MSDQVRVLGVRHHGPGSARAVRRALDEWRPDAVLIEGPPEADRLVEHVADPDLVPPVALLAYRADDPGRAAFWPLAVFSPEWQALRWAVDNGVGVRFMDLPAAVVLADERAEPGEGVEETVRGDPIAVLARAAGYDDPERWWDDAIESRPGGDAFAAVAAAMGEVREHAPPPRTPAEKVREDQREAQMRKVLRAALKDGAERVAVVCGAWHAPALSGRLPPASQDNALLRGLAKVKVSMAWVPWTHSRLASWSGYGAGVESPGWYHHLFTSDDHVVSRWMTHAAGVLREHDLTASSAHVIESVRLADALAALRGRPLAGLTEVSDAARAVLCEGSEVAVGLLAANAVVGEQLGTVPESAPTVPLEADFRAKARAARLKLSAEPVELTLDLRTDTGRRRSQLLHRLAVVGVPWGRRAATSGIGTFKEGWQVVWEPELSVALIEASLWGTTLESAAVARLIRRTDTVGEVTAAISAALTAELPDALPELLRQLDARAAQTMDVTELLAAVVPLIEAQRYGTVRGTDTAELAGVARAMLARACAGLGPALAGLDADAAAEARGRLDEVHRVVSLLAGADEIWRPTLVALVDRADLPAGIAGRVVRMLLDGGELSAEAAATRLSAALSGGTEPERKALWVEGFLAGGPLLLIHDRRLLGVLDEWVLSLGEEDFVETLPMLRRTLGQFGPAERRELNRLAGSSHAPEKSVSVDADLAAAGPVLATVRSILGAR